MKKILIWFIAHSGFPLLFRWVFQKNKITVIFYHDIDPENFEKQIVYLRKKYTLIDLQTFKEILIDKNVKPQKNLLLITFDDGHIGNFLLTELFKKYQIRPVIFLTASLIDSSEPFWFRIPSIQGSVKKHMKQIPDKQRRELLKEYPFDTANKNPQHLTGEMIRQMKDAVNFQSHSYDHPCLEMCNPSEIEYQLEQSKLIIEKLTEHSVFAIAYPDGSYNNTVTETAERFNYMMGFTGIRGFNSRRETPFLIKRLSTNDTSDFHEFVLRVTGIWHFLKKTGL
jgi:peptidoglycan/xylan/chitin deacetylase (PgdA/CDA1 family)